MISLVVLLMGVVVSLGTPSSLLDHLLKQVRIADISTKATFLMVPVEVSLKESQFDYFLLDEQQLILRPAHDILSVTAHQINVSLSTQLYLNTPLSSSSSRLSLALNDTMLSMSLKGTYDPQYKGEMRVIVQDTALDYRPSVVEQGHRYEAKVLAYVLSLEGTKQKIRESVEQQVQSLLDEAMRREG